MEIEKIRAKEVKKIWSKIKSQRKAKRKAETRRKKALAKKLRKAESKGYRIGQKVQQKKKKRFGRLLKETISGRGKIPKVKITRARIKKAGPKKELIKYGEMWGKGGFM